MGPRPELERRALQIGIRSSIVQQYVNIWILAIEDVTQLARDIKVAVEAKQKQMPIVPQEDVYEVNSEIQKTLGISDS
jgi:predicted transcriptional regulator